MEIGAPIREISEGVVGWRAWTVRETPEGLRLGSVLHDLVWTPGEPAVAACRRDEDPFTLPIGPHPVPAGTCNCGFHAAHDPADVLSYLRGRDEPGTVCRVLGKVALWGHVIEAEAGWRAAMSYPVRLYVDDRAVAAALAVYGVPVVSGLCVSGSATSSSSASAGSSTSSWNAARTRSSRVAASG
jgi:hypothetical protein